MYNLFISIALSLLVICAIGQQPTAHYTFDNTLKDFSGNNNHGKARGGLVPANDRFNRPCGAIHFDGNSFFIEVPNSASLKSITKEFTYTVWYKFDNIVTNQWLSVLCKGNSLIESNSNPQYRFQVQQSPNSASSSCGIGIPIQNGFSTVSFNTEFTKCDFYFRDHLFQSDKWCFYALSYDGNNVNAYMDGKKIYTSNYNGSIVTNDESLYIGLDIPGSKEYFQGSLDDLRIFNIGLSDNEILNFYNEQKSNFPSFDLAFQEDITCYLNADESEKMVKYYYPDNILDNCNTASVSLIEGKASGSYFPVGKNKICYELADNSGSKQRNTFSINVIDSVKPKFYSVPKDTSVYLDASSTSVPFYYSIPKAKDNCGIKSIRRIMGGASGEKLGEGLHTFQYEATDINNNSSIVNFNVTIIKRAVINSKPIIPQIHDTIRIHDTIKVVTNRIVHDTVRYNSNDKTTNLKDSILKLNSDSLSGRKNIIQNVIQISDKTLKISLLDDGIVDGDTVSVYFNGVLIINKQLLTNKPFDFEIKLVEHGDNELVMYANDMGSIPPNTGMLLFTVEDKTYEVRFKSSDESNAKIIFRH